MRTRGTRRLAAAGLAVLLVCGAAASSAGEPDACKSEAEIRGKIARLVVELGDDSWAVRERAGQQLRAVGEPALEALKSAANSPDLEVKMRAGDLVDKITRDMAFSRMGNTLIAENYGNRVVEVDKDGAEVWEVATPAGQPLSAHRLPGGKTLVGCADGGKVLVFDRDKEIVWETTVPGRLFCAEPLDNGNFLVSYCEGDFAADGKVVEIDKDKKVVWEAKAKSPRGCLRLGNGNTLVVENIPGRVREIDKDSKTVWQAVGLSEPWRAMRLDSGNTLIAENSPGRVRELDKDGKEVWSFSEGLHGPTSARRLANGHTLIADYQGRKVVELDKDRKVFWEHACPEIICDAVRLEPPDPPKKTPAPAPSSAK